MKKIFIGLFNNWDSIISLRDVDFQEWNRKYDNLKKFMESRVDGELIINKDEFSFLEKRTRRRVRFLGGNAGNAAECLGEAGLKPVLSCPMRSKTMLSYLSAKGVLIAEEDKIKSPLDCRPNNKEYEHIAIENEGCRHLFTYDPVTERLEIDYDFFSGLKSADLLWISGFHLVSLDFKDKIKEVGDLLEDRMFQIHMELGKGTDMMKFAFEYLVKKNAINSLGFNDSEISVLGTEPHKIDMEDGLGWISEKNGIEKVTLHTKNFISTYSIGMNDKFIKATEKAVMLTAAKSFGVINNESKTLAESLRTSEIKRTVKEKFCIIPTRINPAPKKVTGLGDCFSALDFYYSFS